MDLFTAMDISASGMTAQSLRMNTVSSNLANSETTRTKAGTPYYRQQVVFRPKASFDQELDSRLDNGVRGVEVANILNQEDAVQKIYDPGHPDADGQGFVTKPDINLLTEMTDLMAATRAYEANVTGIKASQRMAIKALEIGG